MVVKDYIKSPRDLKGKTIALQANGPHMYYAAKVLADTGLSVKDVKLVWTKDLTGSDETPLKALFENNVDAAMMISPDAMTATAGGNVGTGGESVKGARILLSTKTADNVIYDLYAVRSDFYEAHRDEVEKFVQGLMMAEEKLADLMTKKTSVDYQKMIKGAAKFLVDSDTPQAISDTDGMYDGCVYMGWKGNVRFFTDPNNPRNFERVVHEVQTGLLGMGLMSQRAPLASANWDYAKFAKVLKNTGGVEAPRFDTGKVARVVTQMQAQGTMDKNVLFSFVVNFKPNQNSFSAELYEDAYKQVIDKAATYGGALITVEGHSDPLNYLKRKRTGASALELGQIKQAAKNLSFTRANAVRDSLIEYAKQQRTSLDPSQFTVVGYGILNPVTGMCGEDPCPPKTEQEWLSNMRVEFRIIQVEAEMSSFETVK
jgi:outer membrane protein OmpA-like peptidoglycan-associated protein